MLRFETRLYPKYVHGIASGAPLPFKGAVVLRVRLLEGEFAENAQDGPEIFVRCKVAARGMAWIDPRRQEDGARLPAWSRCSRVGYSGHQGPLGVKIVRKDRAYAFVSVLSSLDGPDEAEPGGDDRQLRYDSDEPVVCLDPADKADSCPAGL